VLKEHIPSIYRKSLNGGLLWWRQTTTCNRCNRCNRWHWKRASLLII